jgi:D-threo-aldose 1-dehydrogenase
MTTGPVLERRPFGRSTLRATPICMGGGVLGDMVRTFGYSVPEDRALATLRALWDSPINFLDTAASYGNGESERRIGIALRERGGLPADFVLATKADRHPDTNDFSAEQARRSVERSLRLLGLDRLQIVYLHDPELATQDFAEISGPGGAVEALLHLKQEGVIGLVGISGGPIDMLMRYVHTGVFDAVISHNRYTLLSRVADPLLSLASERGLAVVNAAPYGSGILSKGPDAYPRYVYRQAPDDVVRRARQMQALCDQHGVPLAAAALQFSLRDPRITSTIVGFSRPERIAETLSLAALPIPDVLWPQLDALAIPDVDPQRR